MNRVTVARFVTPTLLAVLAIIFGVLSGLDLLRHPTSRSPARRIWARIAVAFAVVSSVLYWLQTR